MHLPLSLSSPTSSAAAPFSAWTSSVLLRFLCRRKCLKHILSIVAVLLILSPALLSLLYPGLRPGRSVTLIPASDGGPGSHATSLLESDLAAENLILPSASALRPRTQAELQAFLLSSAHRDWTHLAWRANTPHVAFALTLSGAWDRLSTLRLLAQLEEQGVPLQHVHLFDDGSGAESATTAERKETDALHELALDAGVRLWNSKAAQPQRRTPNAPLDEARHVSFVLDTLLLPSFQQHNTWTRAVILRSSHSTATRAGRLEAEATVWATDTLFCWTARWCWRRTPSSISSASAPCWKSIRRCDAFRDKPRDKACPCRTNGHLRRERFRLAAAAAARLLPPHLLPL